MADKREVVKKHKDYLFPSVTTYYKEPVVVERAKDQFLYDTDGKQYLDFFGGVLTVSIGHCNDKITKAIHEQLEKVQHTSTLYDHQPAVDLAEKMAQITPGRLQKSYFTNSGTEADDTAVFMAKYFTKLQEVVALRYSYSGRSFLALSITGHSTWRHGGTHVMGIKHVASAYCYRCAYGLTYPSCELRCAKDVEEVILTTTSGQIAAFIAEPIQGVGGFITPPKEYFQEVVSIIRKYGGLFICDEVQTGFARTGKYMFGIEHWGVEPDIMTFAKGMANGIPIGATIATPEIADCFTGLTFSTFGGNPVTCAAALATIDVIEKQNLSRNAQVVGDYFREKLDELKDKYEIIGDVRGMGLMQGIELVKDRKSKEPAKEEILTLFEKTKEKGLLIGKGGLFGNVVRLSPPLTIGNDDVDQAIRILDESFAEMEREN